MQPLRAEDEENLANFDELNSSASSTLSMEKWEEDRFIWDENELDIVNSKRVNADCVPIVKRNPE